MITIVAVLAAVIAGDNDKAITPEVLIAGDRTITPDDFNQPIKIRVGESFIIKLPEQPGTGFSWKEKHDGKILEFLGMLAVAIDPGEAGGRPGVVGQGEWRGIRFRAIKECKETEILLEYVRLADGKKSTKKGPWKLRIEVHKEKKPMNKIQAKGVLHTGVMAIGGETTGVTLDSGEDEYELDLSKVPAGAAAFDGKSVEVVGTLKIIHSIERGLRLIIEVISLRTLPDEEDDE